MDTQQEWRGSPEDLELFKKLLTAPQMFLIDERPRRDLAIVYLTRGIIKKSIIKRYQPRQWLEEFYYMIDGDHFGSINSMRFESIADMVKTFVKRGFTHVEF